MRLKLKSSDPEFEKQFNHYMEKRRVNSLILTGIVSSLYAFFLAFTDYELYHNDGVIGKAILFFVLVAITASAPIKAFRKICGLLGALGIYSFLFVQVYLHHQKLIPTSELGYTVPILLFAVSLGLSLSFRSAVLVNTSIVVVMLLGTYYFNEHGYGSNIISILLTYGIAIGMGYMYERELRIGFHRMNKVVKLNEDLEEANKTKLRLLSIISHDINGPLHNLSTTMDMKESSDLSDEEFKPIFHQIKIKITSIEQLLYSLTNWAKSQTDGFQPDIKSTPLQEVFDIVGAGVRPLAEDKTINLKCGINGAIKVMTDRNMLSIVMRNVIANGIKYSSEGSEINVTAREDGDRLHIHIADRGEGMTEETMNKLFVYTSDTKDGTHSELGTGLGMHLSKKMADHLNLDLRVQSELGKGTTFSFTLPLA